MDRQLSSSSTIAGHRKISGLREISQNGGSTDLKRNLRSSLSCTAPSTGSNGGYISHARHKNAPPRSCCLTLHPTPMCFTTTYERAEYSLAIVSGHVGAGAFVESTLTKPRKFEKRQQHRLNQKENRVFAKVFLVYSVRLYSILF